MVGAPLCAAADQGAAYQALLLTLIPATTLQTVVAGANGPENAGGLYMQALADNFAGTIKAQALDKGAKQVVVANIPTITYTPRFQAVLDQLGASAAGPAGRAQAEALFKGWVNAFNQRLAANFSGESRVKVVDLATRFTDQVLNPAKYNLTNVTLPVFGAAWVTVVPKRSFAECTASAMSATTPPPGAPSGSGLSLRSLFSQTLLPI